MKTAKILYPIISLAIAACCICTAYAEDSPSTAISEVSSTNAYYAEELLDTPLSPGLRVMAYDQPMIISGVTGEKIQFSAEAFNEYSGYVPSSIKILSLPDTTSGTLIYNSNPVSEGQSISVLSLSSLYYEPADSSEVEFTFSSDNTSIMRCILRNKESGNNKPNTSENTTITTQTRLDTAVAGYLDGYDIDGDSITYEIVSSPTKGIVSVVDRGNGQFVYHPYIGMSGNDSFTYRIRDSYGAYSDTNTVNLTVNNSKTNVYDDLVDSYYASAVNDVVDLGIMQVSKEKDVEYFNPEEPVSRIDFLIMAMKSMGAGEAEPISSTVFADDNTLSDTEKGYLSAAHRLGVVKGSVNNGKLVFMPDEPITGASAAVIINGILGIDNSDTIQTISQNADIPTWAAPSFNALTSAGIMNNKHTPWDSVLSRENVAVILSNLMHELA